MTIIQNQVTKDIETFLEATKKRCEHKMAYNPKGWTQINIKECSEDIVKELCKKYSFIKK